MASELMCAECPFCHEKPNIGETDETAYSRKRTLYGNMHIKIGTTFYTYLSHVCQKRPGSYDERRIYAEGRCTIWGNYDGGITSRVYDPVEYEKSRKHSEEIAVKKWNKKIKEIMREVKDGK